MMVKPTGAICNLDCSYCYYLSKEALYSGDQFRMRDEILELYLRQMIEASCQPVVTLAWQGGEPTMMGLPFFRRAVALAESLIRPGQRLEHTLQTNATLLTDEWVSFLAEHDFLVGVSIDGPQIIHDAYRVDKKGRGTFTKVMRGLTRLRVAGIRYNLLCTVHRLNEDHPIDVYRFLRDECGGEYIQFIPIVERNAPNAETAVSERSVTPSGWGTFLSTIYDEWITRDIGNIFVQTFDAALASWIGLPAGICIFDETCGNAMALEHNGDVYSCDHFVDPGHLLGNINNVHIAQLTESVAQRRFGDSKRDSLPKYCRSCDVKFACNGECPKNRFIKTPDGEDGLNYLCAGYLHFFHHINGTMSMMADLIRTGRPATEISNIFSNSPRNASCPCGSGRKSKQCHGQ